ncbi:MAG: hypothetical protein LIO93_02670 [Bacteroidales bacterium]|nr:hypothetical protein [Bacteroidales bacterium]
MKNLLFIFCILICCFDVSAQNNPFIKGYEDNSDLPIVDSSYENYIYTSGTLPEHFITGKRGERFFADFTPVIVPEYFFLGTLNPLPQKKNPLQGDKVDYYRKEEEEPLVEYLQTYLKQTLNISVTVKQEEYGYIGIYSPELMEIKRSFFDEKTGALKEDIFHTDEEIASYILGVYYRFGRKGDADNYRLPTAKIYIGLDRMFSFLLKMRSKKVSYLYVPEPTPEDSPLLLGGYKLIFEPSQYLKTYLDTIQEEKEKLPYIYL